MDQSMYSALFGALSNEMRLTLSVNNLANVNTTGYKRDRIAFEDVFLRMAHDYAPDARASIRQEKLLPDALVVAKPRLAMQSTDFSQGALQVTGNPLDVAIQGPGFFKIRTPEGDFYSRDGSFMRSGDGTLVTAQGYQVLGGGGPVDVPQGKELTIAVDGQVSVDGAPVGVIDVVKVNNEEALKKYGANLYQGMDGVAVQEGALDETETQVVQGYLEKPNVEVVEEMVAMIDTQRSFEAYQKVITSSYELDQKAVQNGKDK